MNVAASVGVIYVLKTDQISFKYYIWNMLTFERKDVRHIDENAIVIYLFDEILYIKYFE